ncbi:MAG: biopolymer transporter ExbD [Planctomycetes bacterium]|nr:biopolymer transporter ExbD [Planctomycetota bacterium]
MVYQQSGETQSDNKSQEDALLLSIRSGQKNPRIRKATDEDPLDLTSMVDVTFLLLIFFMLTASFTVQKTFEVPNSDPDQEAAQQSLPTLDELENDHMVIRILADNTITLDHEMTTRDRLIRDLQTTRHKTQRNALLILAENASLHETTVGVIDAATGAGVQQIRYALPGSGLPEK